LFIQKKGWREAERERMWKVEDRERKRDVTLYARW